MRRQLLWLVFASGVVWSSPWVTMHTNQGDVLIELNEIDAPATVRNFLNYAEEGHYAGTVFHRVIPHFMIQGGGYDATLEQKPTHAPIANEAHNGLRNVRGSIAMARTSDPHSATDQFFINLVDNPFLDKGVRDPHGYAVFGQVIEGMDVVDVIGNVATEAKAPFAKDVPVTPVVILSVEISETHPLKSNLETEESK